MSVVSPSQKLMIKQKQKQKQKHIRMIDHTHDQRCGDLKRRIKKDAWTAWTK